MKPRSPTVRRGLAARLQAQQEDRLIRIAQGQLEPGCARERLFLKRARRTCLVRTADFLLPAVLYLAERTALGPEADEEPSAS